MNWESFQCALQLVVDNGLTLHLPGLAAHNFTLQHGTIGAEEGKVNFSKEREESIQYSSVTLLPVPSGLGTSSLINRRELNRSFPKIQLWIDTSLDFCNIICPSQSFIISKHNKKKYK